MSSISTQLAAIAKNTDQKVKIQQYKDLLAKLVETPKVADFKAFVDHSTLCFLSYLIVAFSHASYKKKPFVRCSDI